MKKIAFTLYVLALVIMFPMYVVLELNSVKNKSIVQTVKKENQHLAFAKVKMLKDSKAYFNNLHLTVTTNP